MLKIRSWFINPFSLRSSHGVNPWLFVFAVFAVDAVLLVQVSQAQTETVIYNFKGGTSDGSAPWAGLLLDSRGNLFGTTTAGGTYNNSNRSGTVYELSPAGSGWTEQVLYNFGGALDGYQPTSGLVEDSLGNLYGTTVNGGQGLPCGTFFRVTPGIRWTETGLFTFPCGRAGQQPYNLGKLAVDSEGNFYGTTFEGGTVGQGIVFEMSISLEIATETVLYSFDRSGGHLDGDYPYGSVIMDLQGNLYGTTFEGGVNGWGTVFELSPQEGGTYSEGIIHNFNTGPSDGLNPYAGLVMDRYGNLFGTTYGGGLYGYGTVFELLPNGHGLWTELVIHSFRGPAHADGANPYGGLIIDSNRNLYGTTFTGGAHAAGTVYKLSPVGGILWNESVLYSFKVGPSDGANPRGELVMDGHGNLYGTTVSGGNSGPGHGTVFKIAP